MKKLILISILFFSVTNCFCQITDTLDINQMDSKLQKKTDIIINKFIRSSDDNLLLKLDTTIRHFIIFSFEKSFSPLFKSAVSVDLQYMDSVISKPKLDTITLKDIVEDIHLKTKVYYSQFSNSRVNDTVKVTVTTKSLTNGELNDVNGYSVFWNYWLYHNNTALPGHEFGNPIAPSSIGYLAPGKYMIWVQKVDSNIREPLNPKPYDITPAKPDNQNIIIPVNAN